MALFHLTPKGDRHAKSKGLMQAVVDPQVAAGPKLGKLDANG